MNKTKPTIKQVITVLERSADIKFIESELWLAVIIQSIKDLQNKKQKKLIKDCLEFHESKYFEEVCDHAGLNPEYARKTIKLLYAPI